MAMSPAGLKKRSKQILTLLRQREMDIFDSKFIQFELKISRQTSQRILSWMVDATLINNLSDGRSSSYQVLNLCQDLVRSSGSQKWVTKVGHKPSNGSETTKVGHKNESLLPTSNGKSLSMYYSYSSIGKEPSISDIGVGPQTTDSLDNDNPLIEKKFRAMEKPKPKSKRRRGRKTTHEEERAYYAMAVRMATCVRAVKGWVQTDEITVWQDDFRLLCEKDKVPISVAARMLDWYCGRKEAGNTAGLPRVCWTGKAFRKFYSWIFNMWQPDDIVQEITPAVKATLEWHSDTIASRGLRVPELADLLVTVQQWAKSEQLRVEDIPDDSVDKCIQKSLRGLLDTVYEGSGIMDLFFTFLLERTEGWGRWGRSMAQWRPGGKFFMEYLQSRSQDRWGDYLQAAEKTWFAQGF